MDFHGAKNNRTWYFYRELAATVRHISLGCYAQQHILNRMDFYELGDVDSFRLEGEKTLEFLNSILIRVAPVILEEAAKLEISLPGASFEPQDFPGVITSEVLEHNIDDDEDALPFQSHYIVKIASEFIKTSKDFDQFGFYEPYSYAEMLELVPDKVNEAEIRRFQVLVHNLQSSFDTYVIHGGYRFGNRRLKQLRAHFSVSFHLLQIVSRLLHYYERHLRVRGFKDSYKKVQEILCDYVDPEILLSRTVNYALYYVNHFLNSGTQLAKELLNEHVEQATITVGIPVKLGFHSRPSLMVAKIVQHYGGRVDLCVGDALFDASSVLDIQWAGGKIQKEGLQDVAFRGDIRALKDIQILASVNYGEDSMGKGIPLPRELAYLR
ncbi:HPr family phosphocarrier protein [Desulfobotulus sp. H1]|uniref:HPr family phosphocarrier protein n=1 Tax=Desulfobotulus pelophilus TaxID=2823377 RepID=A0ABT3NE43_9BACT|nr:HPr family phosphocarrier protein [Desulfobotulus pelophilus]MCW7755192.1 HPr family phosphocarrier protein [Desulfobotulus pelophilus]